MAQPADNCRSVPSMSRKRIRSARRLAHLRQGDSTPQSVLYTELGENEKTQPAETGWASRGRIIFNEANELMEPRACLPLSPAPAPPPELPQNARLWPVPRVRPLLAPES